MLKYLIFQKILLKDYELQANNYEFIYRFQAREKFDSKKKYEIELKLFWENAYQKDSSQMFSAME
jgi:hypothetical protein